MIIIDKMAITRQTIRSTRDGCVCIKHTILLHLNAFWVDWADGPGCWCCCCGCCCNPAIAACDWTEKDEGTRFDWPFWWGQEPPQCWVHGDGGIAALGPACEYNTFGFGWWWCGWKLARWAATAAWMEATGELAVELANIWAQFHWVVAAAAEYWPKPWFGSPDMADHLLCPPVKHKLTENSPTQQIRDRTRQGHCDDARSRCRTALLY